MRSFSSAAGIAALVFGLVGVCSATSGVDTSVPGWDRALRQEGWTCLTPPRRTQPGRSGSFSSFQPYPILVQSDANISQATPSAPARSTPVRPCASQEEASSKARTPACPTTAASTTPSTPTPTASSATARTAPSPISRPTTTQFPATAVRSRARTASTATTKVDSCRLTGLAVVPRPSMRFPLLGTACCRRRQLPRL